jgi:hypothetical protein
MSTLQSFISNYKLIASQMSDPLLMKEFLRNYVLMEEYGRSFPSIVKEDDLPTHYNTDFFHKHLIFRDELERRIGRDFFKGV